MWDWKRITSVATLFGAAAVCVLVPGLGLVAAGPVLASSGLALAIGINAKPVTPKAPTAKKGN